MPIEILDALPAQFRAGDTVKLTREGGDFPAVDWPSRLIIFQKGATRYRINGTVSGANFSFEIKPTASKNWEPGQYTWVEFAVNAASERAEIANGSVYIGSNLVDGSPKTHARKILENLQAKLENRALPNNDIESSNINGQQIIRMSTEQLVKLIAYYEAKVFAEDRKDASVGSRGRGSFIRMTA